MSKIRYRVVFEKKRFLEKFKIKKYVGDTWEDALFPDKKSSVPRVHEFWLAGEAIQFLYSQFNQEVSYLNVAYECVIDDDVKIQR